MATTSIVDPHGTGTWPAKGLQMSEEDFVNWAMTEEVRAEWVNGEVVSMSPAALKHVEIGNWLVQVLGLYIRAKSLGKLLGPEFMIRLNRSGVSRRVPDLLYVATANLHNLRENHLEGAPDLAIEIVSPDSIARDWREKYLEYDAAGVNEYWIVDPLHETLEASARNAAGKFAKLELDANGALHSATASGFWLKPEWLWQPDLVDPIQHLRDLGAL